MHRRFPGRCQAQQQPVILSLEIAAFCLALMTLLAPGADIGARQLLLRAVELVVHDTVGFR